MIRKQAVSPIDAAAPSVGVITRSGGPPETTEPAGAPDGRRILGRRPALRIGLGCSLHWGQARRLISDFRKSLPEVELAVADVDEVEAGASLLDDDLDVAILIQSAVPRGLRSTELWSERLIAVMPDGHRLAKDDIVAIADLRKEEILLAGSSGALQDTIMRALGGPAAFTRQPVARDTLFDLVALHFGVTIVATGSTGAFYPGVVFRSISPSASVTYQLLWNPRNHNPVLQAFTRFTQTMLQADGRNGRDAARLDQT